MIYYLPLEHIEARYTKAMDSIIVKELKRQKKDFKRIDGKVLTGKIKVGAFLDANSTNHYKFTQLQEVTKLFAQGKIKDGDIFFVSDLWFPGIEAIPYMAYFGGIKVKIMGILHAGSFTETDYVANMKDWAKHIEKGWFNIADKIFVGSNQTKKELIEKGMVEHFGKIITTGIPIDTEEMYKLAKPLDWEQKEDIVLFSGRLDDEKQPWYFDELKTSGIKIKTLEQNLSKKEYYKLLARSKVMVSYALQENFGIAAIEAAAYGVNLVLPDRLSYQYIYPERFLYSSLEQATEMVENFLHENTDGLLWLVASYQDGNVKRIVSELC